MAKYVDTDGLRYFWGKIKGKFALASHTHAISQVDDLQNSLNEKFTRYTIPNNGRARSYARICSMKACIGNFRGNLSALIMGASNYDGQEIPLIVLSFSTRGYSGSGALPSNMVHATRIGSGHEVGSVSFLCRLNGSMVELWMSAARYPYPVKMIVFDAAQVQMNLDSNTTEAPTGTVRTYPIEVVSTVGSNSPISETSIVKTTTATTSTFTATGYDSSKMVLHVFINGLKLIKGTDYTISGTTVTLKKPLSSGQTVEMCMIKTS